MSDFCKCCGVDFINHLGAEELCVSNNYLCKRARAMKNAILGAIRIYIADKKCHKCDDKLADDMYEFMVEMLKDEDNFNLLLKDDKQ